MTVDIFIDYFRQLAINHSLIMHNPLAETEDAAVGSNRFARFSTEEVISGLRTKVSFPALMIELYELNISNENLYDVKGNYKAAFSIFASAPSQDSKKIEEAYVLTEKIMLDMLKRIWQDHYGSNIDKCNTPFSLFAFDGEMIPVGPVFDSEYGWRYEFSFTPKQFDFNQPIEDGVFLN
jgi:hypothetical protein